MAFSLTPPVPPNIPEDKVYSINDFNNYFDQLQKIISEHDDKLLSLISETAGYFPFYKDPVDTIDKVLSVGIYYLSSKVGGTFPEGSSKDGSFLISTGTMQFLFDSTGIYCRVSNGNWVKTSGAAVIDSLTSSSTIDSLSANQGRVLNEKKLNQFTYGPEDNVNIDNLTQGVHVFNNAQVTGTFPEFSFIISGNNKFTIESLGSVNGLTFQILSDISSTTVGVRVGTNIDGIDGEKIWQWFDWQQVTTDSNIAEIFNSAEDIRIDCGEF